MLSAQPQPSPAVLRYAHTLSPLGTVTVAIRDNAVCAVILSDDVEQAFQDLQRMFKGEPLQHDEENVSSLCLRVKQKILKPGLGDDIELRVVGTPFQQRVWKQLLTIPAGETRSYSELAFLIGKPKAVRAVASACAANRIAVLIPCHRVVRQDGVLSGYRWGLARKNELLRLENTRQQSFS
ncbi:methylated-DNA--[protein]-cysteine S-methyltransferase [Paenalcaligenes niemegkensis]|uniref:methylated-DNA--[protein]-cysteine S-methyltransferase n=1 Tax=Paenalcaligenes niemegkensis TaxID=2895469 RepID=UPI001EE7C0B0|nr:methylated-DNA--[protein]-cysteine S-methyltransferase [Paenalcaligenes niemegkensis]MCQ9617845.1 methylated-DNA--[protein]-cysteine S-methyltransferase [Paenalcaligenes niemegkensis]